MNIDTPHMWYIELNHCVFQGNDQIRFELSSYALYPEVKVSSLLHCERGYGLYCLTQHLLK